MATFSAPENKRLFLENERVYDQYLNNFSESYSKQSNSLNYFNEVNTGVKSFTTEAKKMCSKLKHMCYDLSVLFIKTSEQLNQISEYLTKFNKFTNDAYVNLKFRPNQEVIDTNKKLEAGLFQWSKQVLTQSQYIIENMASYFHFRKHEYSTFDLLLETKMKVDETFKKQYTELEEKKQRLFETKNIQKWKIQDLNGRGNINDLLQNYAVARTHMIPNVI